MDNPEIDQLIKVEDLTLRRVMDLLMKLRRGAIEDVDVAKKILKAIKEYLKNYKATTIDKTSLEISEENLIKRVELQLTASYLITEFREIQFERTQSQYADNLLDNWDSLSDAITRMMEDRNKKIEAKSADELLKDAKDYREKPIKQKALDLCDDKEFNDALDMMRSKWRIEVYLPSNLDAVALMSPDILLEERALGGLIPTKEWYKLQGNLRRTFFDNSFGLDASAHYGLVVAALCFGLKFKDIEESWNTIWLIARQENVSGIDVIATIDDSEQIMSLFLTVAYLVHNQSALVHSSESESKKSSIDIDRLPPSIQNWVRQSLVMLYKMSIDLSSIDEAVELLNIQPKDMASRARLLIKIGRATPENAMRRIWKTVEFLKLLIWGNPPKGRRLGRVTSRDIKLAEINDELHDIDASIAALDGDGTYGKLSSYENDGRRQYMIDPPARDTGRKGIARRRKKPRGS